MTDVVRERIARRGRRAAWMVKDAVAAVRRRVAEGSVALTFDDGPNPESTGRVLDVLATLGVQATFFCVGRNAERHPDLVRRALSEGHAVGSHSLTHPHPAQMPLARLTADYAAGRAAVSAAAGRDLRLFRPPHGHLAWRSAVMVRRLEVTPWLWTVDPEDWRPHVTGEQISSVAATARSGDVILLHDWVEQPWAPEALDRSATASALPAIVRAVTARGLRFTTLPT